ncbi:MAG TPA: hypothetical protein VNO79_11920 [Actinomycetota bacterium]|nr:hypothetical protein [Actinomycetota bacterium]
MGSTRPPEALYAGASGWSLAEVGPARASEAEAYELAAGWWQIARERWPREEGESLEAWRARVAREAAACRVDPAAPSEVEVVRALDLELPVPRDVLHLEAAPAVRGRVRPRRPRGLRSERRTSRGGP